MCYNNNKEFKMTKSRSPMCPLKLSVPTYVRLTGYQLRRLKSAVKRGDYMTISEAVRAAVTIMLRGSKRKANSNEEK